MIWNSRSGDRLTTVEDSPLGRRIVQLPRSQRALPRTFRAATRPVISMRAAVKSLLLVAFAGLVLALGAAAPASAATPCWKAVINDWFDGKIDKKYAPECYTQAIKHLPIDVKQYSGAEDDIRRAMLAALRQGNGGNGGGTPAPQPTEPTTRTPQGNVEPQQTLPEGHSKGVILRAIEWLGPSDAASVPMPLLILAAVAFLLLAAAGGSFVNRRLQERRLPPPQA